MNWFICLLLGCVMAFSFNRPKIFIASNAVMDDLQVLAKKSTEQCIKEGSVNGEDVKRIMADELFSSKYNAASEKLQCFLLCYYKKVGIIDAAGKQQPKVLMTYLQQRFSDKWDKVRSALAKCDNIKSSNPCKDIYEFEACVLKNL